LFCFVGLADLSTGGGTQAALMELANLSTSPTDKKALPPSPDLQRNLTRALLKGMEEYDTRAQLGKLGCVETMFLMLDSEFNEVQSLALQCLVGAAKNAENRMIIRVCGGLAKLIEYLGDGEFEATHEKALEVLAVSLTDPESMALVSQRGPADKLNPEGTAAPVTAVIQFVGSADHEVAIQALNCVAKAAALPANRRRLTDQRTEAQVAARADFARCCSHSLSGFLRACAPPTLCPTDPM
jgi:hypothetical protein